MLENSEEQTLPKLVSSRTVVFLEDLSRVVMIVPNVRRNRLEVTPPTCRSDEENAPASPCAIFSRDIDSGKGLPPGDMELSSNAQARGDLHSWMNLLPAWPKLAAAR
jgi:hypothetical protein